MTFSSPNVGGHFINPLKGSRKLTIPKRSPTELPGMNTINYFSLSTALKTWQPVQPVAPKSRGIGRNLSICTYYGILEKTANLPTCMAKLRGSFRELLLPRCLQRIYLLKPHDQTQRSCLGLFWDQLFGVIPGFYLMKSASNFSRSFSASRCAYSLRRGRMRMQSGKFQKISIHILDDTANFANK